MDGKPALTRILISEIVCARFVQDRNAHVALLVDVGMPNLGDELHLGRTQWIVFGESELAVEETSFIQGVRRTQQQNIPNVNVTVVDQTGREAFHRVLLQFVELFSKQERRLRLRHGIERDGRAEEGNEFLD